MEGESCRRAKEEGVLGRRLPPSEVTRETDRVSRRRALGVAFGRPLPPPSGQPSWSSRGVTKGRVRSRKEDRGCQAGVATAQTASSGFKCGSVWLKGFPAQYEMPSTDILQPWSVACSDLPVFCVTWKLSFPTCVLRNLSPWVIWRLSGSQIIFLAVFLPMTSPLPSLPLSACLPLLPPTAHEQTHA